MPSQPQCLVHWINEDRHDVWPLSKVPNEMRQEGRFGLIKYTDGKSYLGKILKISNNFKEIQEAEVKLHEELAKKKAEVPVKRKSEKPKQSGKVASDREVNRALGERQKLPTPLRDAKKKAAEAVKVRRAAQKVVETQEDRQLIKDVSRNLFPLGKKADSSRDADSDDDLVDADDTDEEMPVELSNKVTEENVNKDDNLSDDEDSDDVGEGYKELKEYKNPNTEGFLLYLLKCFGTQCSNASSSNAKVYAKPVEKPGQKMVHLTKGHSLRIPKGARNVLLLDTKAQKSTSNFVRKTLTQIYGNEQLANCTAMGRKKNSISLSPGDLSAIYEFVNERCSQISWSEFTKVVMKKCSQTKSPKSKAKDSSPKKAGSARNKSKSPEKSDSPRKSESPLKQALSAVVASPLKFRNDIVVTSLNEKTSGQTCLTNESEGPQGPQAVARNPPDTAPPPMEPRPEYQPYYQHPYAPPAYQQAPPQSNAYWGPWSHWADAPPPQQYGQQWPTQYPSQTPPSNITSL